MYNDSKDEEYWEAKYKKEDETKTYKSEKSLFKNISWILIIIVVVFL